MEINFPPEEALMDVYFIIKFQCSVCLAMTSYAGIIIDNYFPLHTGESLKTVLNLANHNYRGLLINNAPIICAYITLCANYTITQSVREKVYWPVFTQQKSHLCGHITWFKFDHIIVLCSPEPYP